MNFDASVQQLCRRYARLLGAAVREGVAAELRAIADEIALARQEDALKVTLPNGITVQTESAGDVEALMRWLDAAPPLMLEPAPAHELTPDEFPTGPIDPALARPAVPLSSPPPAVEKSAKPRPKDPRTWGDDFEALAQVSPVHPAAVQREEAVPLAAVRNKGKDYTGCRLGTFVATERVGFDKYKNALWFFRCEKCGAAKTWSTNEIARAQRKLDRLGVPPRHKGCGWAPPGVERAAAPEAPTPASAPAKPASEAPAREDAPIRVPAPIRDPRAEMKQPSGNETTPEKRNKPSNEVAKQEPAAARHSNGGLADEAVRSLVRTMAARVAVQHPGVERAELIQVGLRAAEAAAGQWNRTTGKPFVVFANTVIREAMLEHARKAPETEDGLLDASLAAAEGDGARPWGEATKDPLNRGVDADEGDGGGEEEEAAE